MSETVFRHVDVFIPIKFLETLPVCVFGLYWKKEKNNYSLNCTVAFEFKSTANKQFLTCTRAVERQNNESNLFAECRSCFGVLFSSCGDSAVTSELQRLSRPAMTVQVGESARLILLNWEIQSCQNFSCSSSVILYDSDKFYRSELLLDDPKDSFVNFLFESWRMSESDFKLALPEKLDDEIRFCVDPCQFPWIKEKILNSVILLLSILCYICDWWSIRMPRTVQKVLTVTTVGKQVACKAQHLKTILHQLSHNKKITLLSGNLLSALALDAVFGLLLTSVFCKYLQPVAVVETVIDQTDVVVNHLQQLLHWLMGVPAGLKLNLPLNSALGRFFLYHIYLWKTYIVLIKPFLVAMLEFSMHFGVLGLSFPISFCTDLFSLATLHIYCFYGYAARIYSLKLDSLVAFWRLFRGRKWNPLRKRVDSFTYDVQQLFLGTLIFTVSVFLLPTVALYYAVFSVLRLLVLVLQVLVYKVIDVVIAFPMYVIVLQLLGHPLVKGGVNMKVVSSSQDSISFSLELISLSFFAVSHKTVRGGNFCTALTVKDILNNIIFGKVIYPL